jgi:CheY-like chemotaxis protein/predicted hydrocarbon binding protein
MSSDLVYVLHPEPATAAALSGGLEAAHYEVVRLATVAEVRYLTSRRQFALPDAILTPLADVESGDSMLIELYQSNPLMEQIPLVVVASTERDERRRALRMGLLSVVVPPYDGEEVALTTKIAIEKHRSEQLLFGSLTQMSVPDLLQIAEAGRRSGTVCIQHNGDRGKVWMRDGMVIDAAVGEDCRGQDAMYAIAVWTTGTFEANFGAAVEVPERFRIPPSTLLLEAMRRFDEESASTIPVPVLEEPAELEALDLSVVVLNLVAAYTLHHLRPELALERIGNARTALVGEHSELDLFTLTGEGAVTIADGLVVNFDERRLVLAVATLVSKVFEDLDAALAWRFSRRQLARLLAPWWTRLRDFGFLGPLGLDAADAERAEEIHEFAADGGPMTVMGCYELGDDRLVGAFSPFGSRIEAVDPKVVRGRRLSDILPHDLAELVAHLAERTAAPGTQGGRSAVAVQRLEKGLQKSDLRVAVVAPPSGNGRIVTITRLRDPQRTLSPEIIRDPVTGTLWDDRSGRLLVANDDFLHAFESLFAKSLSHRHHELLQRFGKKWGLRHALRLEHMVQRDYHKTLREMESQMALELLSSSLGVIGLGRFEADLGYRGSGLVVIRHDASPFPGTFAPTAGGACSILSGFHAALLSYLAGRHLAAREARCSRYPGDRCLFVVATEERLTKLMIATPGSPDHELLTEIKNGGEKGGAA